MEYHQHLQHSQHQVLGGNEVSIDCDHTWQTVEEQDYGGDHVLPGRHGAPATPGI